MTVPLKAYRSVPAEPLAGKVVIDTNNYPNRDGQFPELDSGSVTSSELLQQRLPKALVVKCLNTIAFRHRPALARPAGDDAQAKAAVVALLDAIGYDAVDAGSLAEGRRFQPGTPLYGAIYAGGDPDFYNLPPVPAGADLIRRALATADR